MVDMQTTFIMIKPDGVQRGLVADIIGRFETKGLRLVGLRQLIPSMELAETHYAVHKERHDHIKVAAIGNPGLHMPSLMGVIPGSILGLGILVWYRRRR